MYLSQKEFERWGHFCFDGDSGAGSGSGEGGTLSEDALKSFNKRLEKMDGNATGMAMMLFSENYQLREKLRTTEGKVSPEGATVLTGDDAKAWEAYKALGKPDEVKQGLDQRTQLQSQVAEAQRGETLRSVAEAAGYKPSVLAQLDRMAKASGKDLAFEVRDVQIDGETVRAPFVKDGDKELSMSDYATANWGDFMPALTAQSQSQGQGTQQSNGTAYPAQHAGSGGNKPASTKEQAQATLNRAYAPRKAT